MRFDPSTFSIAGPGPNLAPVDFGAADALAAVQRDRAILAGISDFAEKTKAFDTLTAGQRHIWRTNASDKKASLQRDAFLSLGNQGIDPEAWFGQSDPQLHDAYRRAVATLPSSMPPGGLTTPATPPPVVRPPGSTNPPAPPKPRPDPELKGPSTLQLAAGGLFALLAPKYAALALAAPFQEGLRRHEREVERTRDENADAYARWQDGFLETAPKAWAEFGSPLANPLASEPGPRTESEAGSGEHGAELPSQLPEVAPGGAVPGDAASGESDHGASTPGVENLRQMRDNLAQGRYRWMSKAQADRIATLEHDAEDARRYAISTARGADGVGRGSPANLTDALTRLATAKAKTCQEMDSLRVQARGLQELRAKKRSDGGDLGRIHALQRARQADLAGLEALGRQIRARLAASQTSPGRTRGGNGYRVEGP